MPEQRLAILGIAALVVSAVVFVVVAVFVTWMMLTPGEAGLGVAAMSVVPMGVSAAVGITVCTVASIKHARPVWARRVAWALSILAALPALYIAIGVVGIWLTLSVIGVSSYLP